MNIAILCHTAAAGSGVLATELAIGLSQLGHNIHIIGEHTPFRLVWPCEVLVNSDGSYKDLGSSPSPRTFLGQIYSLVRRTFSSRLRAPAASVKTGQLHFHEIFPYESPMVQSSSFVTLRTANTLASLIERFKIDVVNAHYVVPHATSAILARESGLDVAVVTTLHGTDVTKMGCDPAFSYTTRHAMNASDALTAVCGFLGSEAARSFGVTTPISVIKNWVDASRFVRISDPKLRARYVQPAERLLVHVSNFQSAKNSPAVIKIFEKIQKQVPARLILIGEGPDRKKCLELAEELGIAGRVLSIPALPDVESILGLADVFLLPSELEGAPLVLLEAMAAGAITIASAVGGVSEIVEHGSTGFLFKNTDLDSMAQQAIEIFSHPELAEKVRSNARQAILGQHDPERLIAEYQGVYAAALGKRREREAAVLRVAQG